MRRLTESARAASPWTTVAGSYFGYCLFGLFALAVTLRGAALAIPAMFVLGAVPLLDLLSGESRAEFVGSSFGRAQRLLLAAAPVGFVIGNTLVIAITAVQFTHFSVVERLLAVLSAGIIGSIGITAAHELVHKSRPAQKLFGRLGLLNVCYLHFEINHIQGHHVWIGTDRDESTAWRGESLYRFIARTVPGCLRLSWALEVKRLGRRGARVFSVRNRMLQYLVAQLVYLGLLASASGVPGVLFFLGQAAVAVFMLESVSYIEHYGLLRPRLPNGRFAPVETMHSWDSYHRFSNYLEFHLQRHADHHAAPTRSQQLLACTTGAPQLPAGYPVMITVAMFPPIWRRVIHPLIPPSPHE